MRSSYPKIWTDVYNDSWFLGLSATRRSIWLQLIIWAKLHGDTGIISGRSWGALGSAWGCDGKTCGKILRKFRDDGKILLDELDNNVKVITIVNYKHYQQDKRANEADINIEKSKEKAGKIPLLTEYNVTEGNNSSAKAAEIKSQFRTPAQKWNDRVIETTVKEYDKLWNTEKGIEPKTILLFYNMTQRSIGMLIICLRRCRQFENKKDKNGKYNKINNLISFFKVQIKNNGTWLESEKTEIKQIDQSFEMDFKSKADVKSIMDVFKG